MTEHTPGPWTIDQLHGATADETEITVCADHGDAIAVIALEQHYDSEAQANARLIAAAPAMLAALRELLEYYDPTLPSGSEEADAARERAYVNGKNTVAAAEGR